MANITGRTYVAPPAVTPSRAGILNAADVRPGTVELFGVAYDLDTQLAVQPLSGDFFDCSATTALGDYSGFAFQEGENPFALFYGVACTTGATEAEFSAKASKSLEAAESFGVERHLWDTVFPERATDITPAGGPVKPKRALGLLLEWAGKQYAGTPLIHAGKLLSVYLASEALLDPDSDEAATVGGAVLVNGAGYFGKNVEAVSGEAGGNPVTFESAAGMTLVSNATFAGYTGAPAAGDTVYAAPEPVVHLANGSTKAQTGIKWFVNGTEVSGFNDNFVTVPSGTVESMSAEFSYDDGTGTDTKSVYTHQFFGEVGGAAPEQIEDNEAWMYVTGSIVLYRSETQEHVVTEYGTNQRVAIAERVYVPVVEAIVGRIRVVVE